VEIKIFHLIQNKKFSQEKSFKFQQIWGLVISNVDYMTRVVGHIIDITDESTQKNNTKKTEENRLRK
jgi:hypothetical protein